MSVRRANAFDALRAAVHDAVLSPGDDGFQSASSPWNRAVRQRPSVVVRAVRPDDVVTAVRFAGEHGMPMGVQAAGHRARLPADGALLVDTSPLGEIEVDPAARLARIGAGARLLDVVLAAERHGLAIPAGYARTVGAVGYTGSLRVTTDRLTRAPDQNTEGILEVIAERAVSPVSIG